MRKKVTGPGYDTEPIEERELREYAEWNRHLKKHDQGAKELNGYGDFDEEPNYYEDWN